MSQTSSEIIRVSADKHQVACNGGGGALGHPKVYYSFDGKDTIVCGYCGKVYAHTQEHA